MVIERIWTSELLQIKLSWLSYLIYKHLVSICIWLGYLTYLIYSNILTLFGVFVKLILLFENTSQISRKTMRHLIDRSLTNTIICKCTKYDKLYWLQDVIVTFDVMDQFQYFWYQITAVTFRIQIIQITLKKIPLMQFYMQIELIYIEYI